MVCPALPGHFLLACDMGYRIIAYALLAVAVLTLIVAMIAAQRPW
jgi:hypothetical protein